MPSLAWQERAEAFVKASAQELWEPCGAEALAYLHKRGLRDQTIMTAEIGYNRYDRRDSCEAWGLEGNRVWLPRGIVIPSRLDGQLWRIDIRRRVGSPKYLAVKGSRNVMYNADALTYGHAAIMTEGVFDALSISQEAGDLIVPVACSTRGGRGVRWVSKLALCSVVLLAFDADEAGDGAAAYWQGILDNAFRWRPYWDDANGMVRDGADLRTWISVGLKAASERMRARSSRAAHRGRPVCPTAWPRVPAAY
jgi:hypothetical protein